jgi:hypothetical protein
MSNPADENAAAAQPMAAGYGGVAPQTVAHATGSSEVRCQNCGARVAQQYCSVCGQRLEPPVHSLWHFSQVAAEDLTHADSRLWRTLYALLFRPGYLTQQFLAGRRAQYLPPIRLYLVLSVVFFLLASAKNSDLQVLELKPPDAGPAKATIIPLEGANESQDRAADPSETPEQRAAHCQTNYNGPWAARIAPLARQACRKAVADHGHALRAAFLHNLPRAMFLFLPILAGLMMLMYWRPRHYYVEHLLLFVHNHAFLFLLGMLAWLLARLPYVSNWVGLGVTLYIAWYVYRSMRVVYGQGRWLTVGKFLLLAFFYFVCGVLMLTLTSVYSALTA